jgi:hypothetical protein
MLISCLLKVEFKVFVLFIEVVDDLRAAVAE